MSKEEKANIAYEENKKLPHKHQIEDSFWIDWYCKGYTAAEQDLSPQLTAYKEVLRELVELADKIKITDTANDSFMFVCKLSKSIEKAKTLMVSQPKEDTCKINEADAGANFVLHQNRWRKVEEDLPEVKKDIYFINIKKSGRKNRDYRYP